MNILKWIRGEFRFWKYEWDKRNNVKMSFTIHYDTLDTYETFAWFSEDSKEFALLLAYNECREYNLPLIVVSDGEYSWEVTQMGIQSTTKDIGMGINAYNMYVLFNPRFSKLSKLTLMGYYEHYLDVFKKVNDRQ